MPVHGDLDAVAEVELGEDAADVAAYGCWFDGESFGDFGVGVAVGDEAGDVAFAGCEQGARISVCWWWGRARGMPRSMTWRAG